VPFYEGIDKGYYKAEGLDVEIQASKDPATSDELVATNKGQFFITVPDPVIFNALARGVDVRLLVSSTTNTPTDKPAGFMVRQDLIDSGRYKTPPDFKGMNVGSGALSGEFYIQRALAKGGLTLNDIKITNIVGLPQILVAMKTKSIDAAWQVEPFITIMQSQHLAKLIFGTGELYPGAVGAALVMSPSFEKDNPEAAVRFLVAYMRAQRDYYHALNKKDVDPTAVIASLVNHTPVKTPALFKVMGLPSLPPNGELDPKTWDPFQDFYIKNGVLKQKVDLTKYMDPQLVNAALDRLGREP